VISFVAMRAGDLRVSLSTIDDMRIGDLVCVGA
jgi:hypothetical protein